MNTPAPNDPYDSVVRKVQAIFTELAGDRARALVGSTFPAGITSAFTMGLIESDSSEEQILLADQIAFHLTDWNADAAFIVAMHLFPERFTAEEIKAGVDLFLVHVPRQVCLAAKLAGKPPVDFDS